MLISDSYGTFVRQMRSGLVALAQWGQLWGALAGWGEFSSENSRSALQIFLSWTYGKSFWADFLKKPTRGRAHCLMEMGTKALTWWWAVGWTECKASSCRQIWTSTALCLGGLSIACFLISPFLQAEKDLSVSFPYFGVVFSDRTYSRVADRRAK